MRSWKLFCGAAFVTLLSGCACNKHVAAPASIGHEKEVPLAPPIVPKGSATVAFAPFAATFGFMSPSLDGPYELNETYIPSASTAATAITLSPSDGALM